MADCDVNGRRSRSRQGPDRPTASPDRRSSPSKTVVVTINGTSLVVSFTTLVAAAAALLGAAVFLRLQVLLSAGTDDKGPGGPQSGTPGSSRRNGPSHLSTLVAVSPSTSPDVRPTLFKFDGRGAPDVASQENQGTSLFPSVYFTIQGRSSGELTGEALSSLHLAREMTKQGKTEKAMKIFSHALALDPKHPDILNEYGEFLEMTKKDTVLADHMYCKALINSPTHTKALSNRQRTLPLVEEIDQNLYNRIDKKRESLMHVPEGHPGLRRMVQENYYRHIYHGAAIEGNTFTLSQTRSFVETRIVISGKSIMEHNEILGMEAALHFLNSSLIKRIGAITIRDIQDIHRRVLGFVDPVGAGLFRMTQVFVADFVPPEPSLVGHLMQEFIEWLNSDDAANLHPIEAAALAHYKLVYIHPFYDGNGRTSRLLMNLILMQSGYPPIIIPVEKKQLYYQHLQTANDGDVRPFIRFIASCTEIMLDEFLMSSDESHSRTFPELSINFSDDGRTILADNNP